MKVSGVRTQMCKLALLQICEWFTNIVENEPNGQLGNSRGPSKQISAELFRTENNPLNSAMVVEWIPPSSWCQASRGACFDAQKNSKSGWCHWLVHCELSGNVIRCMSMNQSSMFVCLIHWVSPAWSFLNETGILWEGLMAGQNTMTRTNFCLASTVKGHQGWTNSFPAQLIKRSRTRRRATNTRERGVKGEVRLGPCIVVDYV